MRAMGDPYYAVGSFYYEGQAYPKREYVEQALAQARVDLRAAWHGAHGWMRDDARELARIIRGLRYFLRTDYPERVFFATQKPSPV